MGKRKADIFTVVESINNWFEAHNHDLTTPEVSAELSNRSGTHDKGTVYTQGDEAAELGPSLIGVTINLGSGTSAAEVAPPGGLQLEGRTADPISSEVELGGGGIEPIDPEVEPEEGARNFLWSEVLGSAGSPQEAFWKLLQAARYECW